MTQSNASPVISFRSQPLTLPPQGPATRGPATQGPATRGPATRGPGPKSPAPHWILLIPAGESVGRDGRRFINDRPGRLIARFRQDGPLPLDYEHATEIKGPKGEAAPAAGWIEELALCDGAIFGRVDWTAAGRARVEAREYRFISPAFLLEEAPQTAAPQGASQAASQNNGVPARRVVRLLSVGLTNRPNLRIPALNRIQEQEEQSMSLEPIAQALDLDPAASLEDILAAIESLKAAADPNSDPAATPPGTAPGTAPGSAPGLEEAVPRADFEALRAELEAHKTQSLQREVEREVAAALRAGRIAPASAAYHRAQCHAEGGLERFRDFVSRQPEIAAGDRVLANRILAKGLPADGALSHDELALCRRMNLSPQAFLAARREDEAGYQKED